MDTIIQTEKRNRPAYKQKYLTARGIMAVMAGVIILMSIVLFYSFRGIYRLQNQLQTAKTVTVLPDGGFK